MNLLIPQLLCCFCLCYGIPLEGNSVNQETGVDAASLSYLLRNGYYAAPDSSEVGQIANQEKISSALIDFQKFAHIPVTGRFDSATKDMMAKPRCGLPDKRNDGNSKRKKRYLHQGSTWKKTDLTWALENNNNDGISRIDVRRIMQRSFNKWQSITNLQFTEAIGSAAKSSDIKVRFETGKHDDSFPFDGKGGTLAHAFYPLGNTGISGDVHFDDDEIFTIKDDETDRSKKKLLWIAVHELGHSIGLDHSNTKGAVMFPWYQHFEGDDFDLTEDDRLGIQTLYGSRVRATKKPTTRTLTPSGVGRRQCTDHVGAVLYGKNGKTYVFNNDFYYLIYREEEGMGVEEGPKPVQSLFPGISFIDAVFRQANDKLVIFHGDKFSVYDGTKPYREARLISDGFHRLPVGISNIDASFFWTQNLKLYIFKGEMYYRLTDTFNSNDYTLDRGYPKRIASNWQGLPPSIDAVFQWKNEETYFFKDDVYYRWNTRHNRVQSGYPQKNTNSFLECTKGSFLLQRKLASPSVKNKPLLFLVLFISLLASLQTL